MNLKSKATACYKNIIFRMSANNSYLFLFFYEFLYKPSKGSLDEFTSLFSRSREKVTVVQVGANDGINNDPIHKFIKRDRWQGVLLEPQKFVFDKYLQPLYKKTKGIVTMNAALDIEDGFKPIYKISVSNARWATGLTSFNRAILEEAIRSGYIERQAIKEGCPLPKNIEEYITEESVECICTESLINKLGLSRIDWLQIDTEGFDFEIIKMFNIGVTKPAVIVYENLHFPPSLRNECLTYLKQFNYECHDFGPNTLAMRKPVDGFERFFVNYV